MNVASVVLMTSPLFLPQTNSSNLLQKPMMKAKEWASP